MVKETILNTIKKYNLIEPNDTIIVAVSGGPDSMCLLDNLIELEQELQIKKIVVAHLNHMIREEAKSETVYVQEYCKNKEIDCYVKFVDILKKSTELKIGTEECGRRERYAFFDEISEKVGANKIAIAHNLNDNAETVLMHLLRGSGISGLGGIKPYREGKFIRPLIKCDRADIENYCEEKNLQPKFDKTNKDNTYTRNRIRNELIPYIQKKFNPNIIETLDRLSELVLDEEDYMQNATEKAFTEILIEQENTKIVLNLKKFNQQEHVIKTRIIMQTTKILYGTSNGIEKKHNYCNVGYVIMYDYWGNGYASEALKAVSNYLLNSGYYLVECSCNELNVQSSKVMLKAGFKKDGYIANRRLNKDGSYSGVEYYSKTK